MRPKDIRLRVAEHEAAILANKPLFDQFFRKEVWCKITPLSRNIKGRYPTKKTFKPNKDLHLLGKILKAHFDYGPMTNINDILYHFKRRYDNLNNSI